MINIWHYSSYDLHFNGKSLNRVHVTVNVVHVLEMSGKKNSHE